MLNFTAGIQPKAFAMQYTKIKLLNRPMIIDVQEGDIITTFLKSKQMPALQGFEPREVIRSVVYGAALHNEGCEQINHRGQVGCLYAYPQAGGYTLLMVKDIHTAPTLVSGGLTFTPFAALVESNGPLEVAEGKGLSAFLRHEEMDIITDMLNRECVYAIREIECRPEEGSRSSWKCAIDEDRLLEIAMGIE